MSLERRFLSIISGRSRGIAPGVVRAGLGAIEPLYRSLIRSRNVLFDRGVKPVCDLGRPTISVGNLTTGGTGKTPVVQWLATRLRDAGKRPAILLRGYRAADGVSDEAELLKQTGAAVEANPDRVAGARVVLQRDPGITHFILDDGFQHRRAKRDLDLVLIDATNPFGYEHVIPRGLLREPPEALRRASAILITRADALDDLAPLLQRLRALAPAAPIFRARHAIVGFVDADDRPIDRTALRRCCVVAGVGNPGAMVGSLKSMGVDVVRTITPGDHHAYTSDDVQRLGDSRGQFDTIVTTEKDWVKLRRLPGAASLPVARAVLKIDFADGDSDGLWALIPHV